MSAPSLARLQTDHVHELAKGQGPGVRQTFLMTTGVECSYPTVEGGKRRDELEGTKHYARWREDFELCRALGARYVRYGPPYYRMHLAPGRYDWSWTDMVLPVMWAEGLIPILDLCHFGVPDWVGSFQNRDWPQHFAEYAGAFAERYPWIKFYTPVNEMLLCSRMSALEGVWNEQEKSDRAFVQAHTGMCRATLLAIEQILKRRADAVFVQSEMTEVYLERWPDMSEAVEFRNHRRFMTFDVLYGKEPDGDILMYLLDNGVSEDEHRWFMRKGREHAARCVLGTDYYALNERTIEPGGQEKPEGAMLGWGMIANDYFHRYRRPMMLTETNMIERGRGEGKDWLLKTWHQAQALRKRGLPVIGYTWFSLTDQIDWDIQLREIKGVVNANGLVDLDRNEHETGRIYRELAHAYGREPLVHTLPSSLCGATP
jgi:beta-glucosidase/6-phospho-beta-glucosidase/beta-galactosidase